MSNTQNIGPAIAYGNTYKNRDALKLLGFRWDSENWVHRNWDFSRDLPKGVTVSAPPAPPTLEALEAQLASAKATASADVVYSNDRQYARAKEAQGRAQDSIRGLESKIEALKAKQAAPAAPAPEPVVLDPLTEALQHLSRLTQVCESEYPPEDQQNLGVKAAREFLTKRGFT